MTEFEYTAARISFVEFSAVDYKTPLSWYFWLFNVNLVAIQFKCLVNLCKPSECKIMSKVNIKTLDSEYISKKGIYNWPIWEKEVSRFDWYYDSDEDCLILEGEVVVETSEGQFAIKAGDFVTFSKGLKCVWDIKKPIRKHYNFR